ncbi:hypothetical protein Bca4012_043824 [Brassica carinata]
MKRVFTIIPTAAFHKMYARWRTLVTFLGSSVSRSRRGSQRTLITLVFLLLPPTSSSSASSGSILLFSTPDPQDRSMSLLPRFSFRDNDRYTKLIIEERGVGSRYLTYPSQSALRGFLSSRGLGVRCFVSLDRDTPITDSFSSHLTM